MVIAGIVAGGVGARMGSSVTPKQFMEIGGKPIVIHTIEKFLVSPEVDHIVVGVHPDWLDYLEDLLCRHVPQSGEIVVTAGGKTRNDTIRAIMDAAQKAWKIDDDTIIVTHDAVRPFVSLEIIAENVQSARKYGVCDTVIPASDTIVRSDNGEAITDVPQRDEMYQGQTPQSFRYGLFREVYESMTPEELTSVTDACTLFHRCGHAVHLVEGSVLNFKITYPFDLKMANSILEESK